MEEIKWSTKPYNVVFKDFHSNKLINIKRRPPEKLHEMLPTDKVELKFKKNDDWPEGEYEVRHINYRSPNTIQIEDEKGSTTFVPSHELELTRKVAHRDKNSENSSEIGYDYLGWP